MTKDDWASLTSCPGWDAFKGYLMAERQKLADEVMDGQVKDPDLKEAIFRAQNLKDIAEMDWRTIAKFYGLEDDNKETK